MADFEGRPPSPGGQNEPVHVAAYGPCTFWEAGLRGFTIRCTEDAWLHASLDLHYDAATQSLQGEADVSPETRVRVTVSAEGIEFVAWDLRSSPDEYGEPSVHTDFVLPPATCQDNVVEQIGLDQWNEKRAFRLRMEVGPPSGPVPPIAPTAPPI